MNEQDRFERRRRNLNLVARRMVDGPTADAPPGFEHFDRKPRGRENRRAMQAGQPCTDDDGVDEGLLVPLRERLFGPDGPVALLPSRPAFVETILGHRGGGARADEHRKREGSHDRTP